MGIQRVRVCDPYDLKPSTKRSRRNWLPTARPSLSVAVPCALLKYVKPKPSPSSTPSACIGCKACLGIGCPAISMRDGKAVIDQTQCVGCGVCADPFAPKPAICAQEAKE